MKNSSHSLSINILIKYKSDHMACLKKVKKIIAVL